MFKLVSVLFFLLLTSCQTHYELEPVITYTLPAKQIQNIPSPFPPLTSLEYRKDWGKELVIANTFANEMDLYRAITAYKRALILIPSDAYERRNQIDYGILYCYYLGKKYSDVIATFENSRLQDLPSTFNAMEDLLIMLHDSYLQIGEYEKAEFYLNLLASLNPQKAQNLQISDAVHQANLSALSNYVSQNCTPSPFDLLNDFSSSSKSIPKARTLNALLPGAGYLYVGQKQTALTSFLINSLFIAAAYQCFHHKNIAAGIILSSLEFGWYFGGITGAGLAAKEFNERLFENSAKDFLLNNQLFPVLMLQYTF